MLRMLAVLNFFFIINKTSKTILVYTVLVVENYINKSTPFHLIVPWGILQLLPFPII